MTPPAPEEKKMANEEITGSYLYGLQKRIEGVMDENSQYKSLIKRLVDIAKYGFDENELNELVKKAQDLVGEGK